MKTVSRIKFNPVTKEIEIEGSELFVKTYFKKIQVMISSVQEAVPLPAQKQTRKTRQLKKAAVVKGKKSTKPPSKLNTVLELIRKSSQGITTTELIKKTGLTEKQIWAIVYRIEKQGKVQKLKRGVYTPA